MPVDSFARPSRRVRRVSLAFSALLHSVAIALLLNYLLGEFRQLTDAPPIARSELVDEDIVRELTARIDKYPMPPQVAEAGATTSIEPGASVIASVAERILNYADNDAGPDPLETVRRNARLLEQISNAKEVDRMADRLRGAMGASSVKIRQPDAGTPPVNWDHAVQSDGKRIEDGDRIEIHESFVDDRGGATTMIHARAPGNTPDSFAYTVSFIETGKRTAPSRCTKADFDDAASRIRAFEVIDQYPLLQELHRSAIVPIIQKLSQNDATSATSQPADPGRQP